MYVLYIYFTHLRKLRGVEMSDPRRVSAHRDSQPDFHPENLRLTPLDCCHYAPRSLAY